MEGIPDMLVSLLNQLKKMEAKTDSMRDGIQLLNDRVSAIDESVSTYRRELDQVKKKQNDLDHEIHILQSLPQRDERLINVEEKLEL